MYIIRYYGVFCQAFYSGAERGLAPARRQGFARLGSPQPASTGERMGAGGFQTLQDNQGAIVPGRPGSRQVHAASTNQVGPEANMTGPESTRVAPLQDSHEHGQRAAAPEQLIAKRRDRNRS